VDLVSIAAEIKSRHRSLTLLALVSLDIPAEALKLYNAVAVPRICYTSDIWYKPPHKRAKGARQQGAVRLTKQLELIQRQVAIAITGMLRTTAGDVATVHMNIKPIALQLKETGLKTYTRYASRPTCHRTALHQLVEASNFKVGEIKTIDTTRAPPSKATPHNYSITESKEALIKWDKENFTNEMMIYTDSSCYKDKVGLSAVLYINGLKTELLKHQLGTKQEHTVFEAELVGILLGTHLAKCHLAAWTPTNINFSINNQATIKAMQKNKLQPVQYLIDEIHWSTKHLLQLLDEE